MKGTLYHDYELNSNIYECNEDIYNFLKSIKYDVGSKILLVGNIGSLGKKLRTSGIDVTILEEGCYGDICYSLVYNENCNVIKGEVNILPFNDEHFDKVIILDYFNSIKNVDKALEEVKRVLKLDGEVIIEDLNLKNIKVKFKNLKHKICGEVNKYYYPEEVLSIFEKLEFSGALKEIENEKYIYVGKRK